MGELVSVALPPALLGALARGTGRPVREVGGAGALDEVDDDRTLAVLATASAGTGLAQAVHEAGPQVTVIYLAAHEDERDAMRGELAITPGIGRHTSCVLAPGPELPSEVLDEVARAELRLEHRRTMDRVRAAVGGFGGAPPETLSVYLGQLFEHAPLGILLVDTEGEVRAANPGSGDVLGWQPRHAVGTALPAMFSGGEAEAAISLVRTCVATGEPTEATLRRTGPDGSVQHLVVTVAPVDPEHWDLGAFVLLRDESGLIHALQAAERARHAAETDAARYAELAWTLQESLLPPDLPDIPGVQVATRYHPAGDGSEIGGDFYDIFQVSDAEWFAVVGDICGKGAGAARLTALTRYTLRATTVRTRTIEGNLGDLNTALSRQYEVDQQRGENRFATAIALRFQAAPDGVSVQAGSGGHPPPLVVRADGSVEEMACRGPLLGVFPTGTFVSDRTTLAPGDLLVLYTDGVTEARRGREEFGEDRLRDLLASLAGRTADAVVGAVEEAVVSFQSGVARDDIAVLALGPSLS
jgi:phosphoserine phosphatase RsbU/P